jgi:hypothetical protein
MLTGRTMPFHERCDTSEKSVSTVSTSAVQ